MTRAGSMDIRPLAYTDIIPLVRICNQAFLEWARFPESGVQAVREIGNSPDWQWGAFEGGTLRGFLLCNPNPEKKHVAIKLVGVEPVAHGRGIGGLLLAHLEDHAARTGHTTLTVSTPFASGFYEKNGFSIGSTTLRMIKDIAQTSVRLPDESAIGLLTMENVQSVLARIPGRDARHRFLEAFLTNVRCHGRFMIRVKTSGRLAGVCIGDPDSMYADLVRVRFALPLAGTLHDLIRPMEYTVSTHGLRYIGFEIEECQEPLFLERGYERAARDFFWTMYTLHKTVRAEPAPEKRFRHRTGEA